MSNTSSFWFAGEDAPTPDGPIIGQSLRWRNGPTKNLTCPTVSTGERSWTWSAWVKKGNNGNNTPLWSPRSDGSASIGLRFGMNGVDNLGYQTGYGGGDGFASTAVFRDPSAWYHVVCQADFTTNLSTIYVNGEYVAQGATTSYLGFDSTDMRFCWGNTDNQTASDFYLADAYLIDGQVLPPTTFGELTEDGVWVPREVSFAYGQNSYSSELWASSTNSPPDFDSTTPYPLSSGSKGFDGNINTYNHGGAGVPANGTLIWRLRTPVENVTGIRFYGSTFQPTWYINEVEQPVSVYNIDGLGSNQAQVYEGDPITVASLAIKCGNNGNFPGWAAIEFQIDGGDYYIVTDPYLWSPDIYTAASNDPNSTSKNFNTGANANPPSSFDDNGNTWAQSVGSDTWLVFRPSTPLTNVNSLAVTCSNNLSEIYVNGDSAGTVTATGDYNEHLPISLPSGFSGTLETLVIKVDQASSVNYPSRFIVNGATLIDGENPNYGVNGFHLDFADSNDIGKDVSGNGNDFTATGFDTAPTVKQTGQYVDETTNLQASGGVFPNTGGTPYWTDVLPANAYNTYPDGTYTPVAGQGLYAVFSGDTTILGNPIKYQPTVYWVSGYSGIYPYSANFDLRDFPEVTSVEVLHKSPDASALWNFWLLDDSKNKITGTDASTTVTGPTTDHYEWLSIPVAGTPRYLHMEAKSSGSSNISMRAFRVNGTVLSQADFTNPAYDVMQDSPSQNFATLNPLDCNQTDNLIDANLTQFDNTSVGGFLGVPGTQKVYGGKFYWEVLMTNVGSTPNTATGITFNPLLLRATSGGVGSVTGEVGYHPSGAINVEGTTEQTVSSYGTGDIIGVAINCDANPPTITFFKNGTQQGTSVDFYGVENGWTPMLGMVDAYNSNNSINAGQQPFLYTPPAGFEALQTQNHRKPTIPNGRDYFRAITGTERTSSTIYVETSNTDPIGALDTSGPSYSLQGQQIPELIDCTNFIVLDLGIVASQAILNTIYVNASDGPLTFNKSTDGVNWTATGVTMHTLGDNVFDGPIRYLRIGKTSTWQADYYRWFTGGILEYAKATFPYGLWWIKSRVSDASENYHQFVDSNRGGTIALKCPNQGTEATYVTPSGNCVAWCWAVDGPPEDNTDGDITSSVATSAKGGFSIINYTGNGVDNTKIGHGLGAKPDFIIWKNRSNGGPYWSVFNSGLYSGSSAPQIQYLNQNSSASNDTNVLGTAAEQTNTYFTVGTYEGTNESASSIQAYAWRAIPGYSAFGKYDTNGSADGPMVNLGFRPAFLMLKNIGIGGSGYSWFIYDTTRNPFNPVGFTLAADQFAAEAVNINLDILSNGFKIRDTAGAINSNNIQYAAFAENPFSYPANAR